MDNSGLIIVLAYPDTVVRPAYAEFSSKIWPLLGIGGKDGVQAGHAALLLISKETKQVDYFDFGRYITTSGFGRVRSKETDVELEVPIKAIFKNDNLVNIEELLLWLEAHPHKTHGDGRLVASVSGDINYTKAQKYIQDLIEQKEIPYGAFVKGGSNCARFVTDTIINSTTNLKVQKKLRQSNIVTPSPIGNVIKGDTVNHIYTVFEREVAEYKNRSVFREYQQCLFKKIDKKIDLIGTEIPDLESFSLENGTWLGGIGSGAWFILESSTEHNQYLISRYDRYGIKDFQGVFDLNDTVFSIEKPYSFVHPTNCNEAFVEQDGVVYCFKSRINSKKFLSVTENEVL